MRLVTEPRKTLSNEDAADLFSLVQHAEKRDDEYFRTMERDKKFLEGNKELDKNGKMKPTINMVHAHVRTVVPTLFFREPTIKAFPTNPIYEKSAPVWEDLINCILRKTDYKKQTSKIISDAVIYPEGWRKWAMHVTPEEETKRVRTGHQTEVPYEGQVPWDNKFVPVGVRISPRNVITDCPKRSIEGSRFIAVKYKKYWSELVRHPIYGPAAKSLRNASGDVDRPVNPADFRVAARDDESAMSHDEDSVWIYEVWVYQLAKLGVYKQLVTFVDGHSKPIRQLTPWSDLLGPSLNRYPFTKIELNPIPDDKPVSELSAWIGLQLSLNWVFAKILATMDQDQVVRMINKSALNNPDKTMAQLNSGAPVVNVEIKDDAGLTRPPVEITNTTAVNRDSWNLIQLIQAVIQQVSGIGQNRRGSSGVRTATEASLIEQGTEIRTSEKVDKVADLIKEDVAILISIIRDWADNTYVFRKIGQTGSAQWGSFTQHDAAWSPDVEVEAESFRQAVDNERLNQYMQLFGLGVQAAPLMGGQLRLDALLQRILETMNVPNPTEIVPQGEMSGMKQMVELIQIIAGLPAQVLPTDNHMAELQAIQAFKASDVYQQMASSMQHLEIVTAIDAHEAEHEQYLQQGGGGTPNLTDPNEYNYPAQATAASEARESTGGDRTRLGANA